MKKIINSLILLFLICFISGCCFNNENSYGSCGYEVTDAKGNIVKLKSKPMRIVSLTLGTDEILMDLVEPKRIIALTSLSDDPGISHISERSKLIKSKIKGRSAEAILALKPDLVIIADWWDLNILDTLRDMNIPVYVYKTPYSLEEVKDSIRELALVVGEKEKGEQVVSEFDKKLKKIQKAVMKIPADKQKSLLPLISHSGFGSKGSIFDDMCKFSHINNQMGQFEAKKAKNLSKEQIIALNPDVFLIPTWDNNGMMKSVEKKELLNDESLATTNAIKNKDIVEVPGKCVYTVSQYVADGVEILAKAVYPKYFKCD